MFEGFTEGRVSTGQADIYVRIGGKGPPLLLLHGFPQTHMAWHRVAPLLARQFTLILHDLRGYGRSRGPKPDAEQRRFAKRAMAEDMAALMTALGHERFRLAGHDRGARVGFRLALDQPARVERFAAIDIIPTLDVWEGLTAERALSGYHWQFLAVPAPLPERLIGAAPEFYYGHLLERWAGEGAALDPAAVADYLGQFRDPRAIAATCAAYRAGASTDRAADAEDRRHGRKIACPVLALWGRRYLKGSPLPAWRNWAEDVREAALDCGHFIVEEKPEEAAEALLSFMGEGP